MNLSDLSNYSGKTFVSPDEWATRLEVPLLCIVDDFPIYKSQARMLYSNFYDYKEIILDFDGLNGVGESFAYEMFVVFAEDNPGIRLTIVNAGDKVMETISEVKNTYN